MTPGSHRLGPSTTAFRPKIWLNMAHGEYAQGVCSVRGPIVFGRSSPVSQVHRPFADIIAQSLKPTGTTIWIDKAPVKHPPHRINAVHDPMVRHNGRLDTKANQAFNPRFPIATLFV